MFEVEVSYIRHNTLQVPSPQLKHSGLYVGSVFRLGHLFVCVKGLLLTLSRSAPHRLSLPVCTAQSLISVLQSNNFSTYSISSTEF